MTREELEAAVADVGQPWGKPRRYWTVAEVGFDRMWDELILPVIRTVDFSVSLDLAAGHGRNSRKLLERAGRLYIVDLHAENIAVCRERFGADPRVSYHVNDGYSLPFVDDGALTLAYSFDAMVHFHVDVVRAYLREFARVLRPGGHAFCHHSNYSADPAGNWRAAPHWRNYMTRELFAHIAEEEGLRVVRQQVIDWGRPETADVVADLDCLSLLSRSAQSRSRSAPDR